MKRVLLIEDQLPFMAQGILEAMGGYSISYVKRGDEAIKLFLSERYDLVLLDLRLPGLPGMKVLEGLIRIEPTLPVIILSAFGDKNTREQAKTLGAAAYYIKPPDYRAVHRRMGELIAQREAADIARIEPPFDERRASLRTQLSQHYRNLNTLQEREARYGGNVPLELLNQIEGEQLEIERLEWELRKRNP